MITVTTSNWNNESVVLCMPSGVLHKPKTLSEHPVSVELQWRALGFDIVPTEDYLSVTVYGVFPEVSTCRKRDYVKALEARPNGHLLMLWPGLSQWDGWRADNQRLTAANNKWVQLRIYRDLKATLLRGATLLDGDNPPRSVAYIREDEQFMCGVNWRENVSADDAIRDVKERYANIAFVETDEEAKAKRKRITLKELAKYNRAFLADTTGDLRAQRLAYIHGTGRSQFSPATQDLVQKWLGCDATENADRRKNYCQKIGGQFCLTNFNQLLTWCAMSDKTHQVSNTRQDTLNMIARTIPELRDTHDSAVQIWDRIDEYVYCFMPAYIHGSMYYTWRLCPKLFIYNTKTKKRLYGEYDTEQDYWNMPIPSLSLLHSSLYPGVVEVIFQKSLKEIFKDTNVMWCFDNAVNVQLQRDMPGHQNTGRMQDDSASVQEYLTEYRGPMLLNILATSGDKLFEQLLKAKLFNLYFAGLKKSASNDLPSMFRPIEGSSRYWGDPCLTYQKKGKNLPQMLGVSLRILRAIDANTCLTYERGWQSSHLRYQIPRVSRLLKAFGSQLNSIDDETMNFWIQLSTEDKGRQTIADMTILEELFPQRTLPQYQALLEKYGKSVQLFKDYHRMRTQLQTIQSLHPEMAGVFSEEKYPLKPEKARKFIPYLNGMRDPRYTYSISAMSAQNFMAYQVQRFPTAQNRLKFVYDDRTRILLGAQIELTPAEHLRYLHDDASYWVRFYQDADKNGLFNKAVDRIRDLEWKDKQLGLEIIAPHDIQHLRAEGAALSHCVASYADAIIDGTENIMFLRRTDYPDMPYYTVEILNDGQIRQVHCFGNGDLTPEGQARAYAACKYVVYDKTFDIVQFLTKWARKFPSRINANSVRSRYGALCALRN